MGSLLAPPLTSSAKHSDPNSPINTTGIKIATIELYRLVLVPGSSRPLQVLSIHFPPPYLWVFPPCSYFPTDQCVQGRYRRKIDRPSLFCYVFFIFCQFPKCLCILNIKATNMEMLKILLKEKKKKYTSSLNYAH